jgi:hypothetical protein
MLAPDLCVYVVVCGLQSSREEVLIAKAVAQVSFVMRARQ